MNIEEIMTTTLVTVTMDDLFEKVHNLIQKCAFHHLLVVEEKELVGVISDRDVLKGISPFIDKPSERIQDRTIMDLKVHQFMTRKPLTIEPDVPISMAISIMSKNNISCLPVVNNQDKLVGIITSNDIIKWAARNYSDK